MGQSTWGQIKNIKLHIVTDIKMGKSEKQKKKKRKASENGDQQDDNPPTKKTDSPNEEASGRAYTVSVALPSSILENAQSPELRTYLAGQVARALVIFNVDEVVIFSENPTHKEGQGKFKGATKATDASVMFYNLLQYLECPQYLRKDFFPFHKDLQYAGLLNPLDCPHHMRMDDISPYREGVTLNRPTKEGKGSFVNAGMRKEVLCDKNLKPGVRVTLKMDPHDAHSIHDRKYLGAKIVSPSTPREEAGIYWGYTVRRASSFQAVFTESSYKEGYDLTVGTSERGECVDSLELPKFRHLLVVFGGVKGLEFSLETDERITESDVELLFDYYINTCPDQGSRTIRTEEAILVTLSG